MKKLFYTLLVLCLVSTSYAHGGRKAADGCHRQTSNGTRHCHGVTSSSSSSSYSSRSYQQRAVPSLGLLQEQAEQRNKEFNEKQKELRLKRLRFRQAALRANQRTRSSNRKQVSSQNKTQKVQSSNYKKKVQPTAKRKYFSRISYRPSSSTTPSKALTSLTSFVKKSVNAICHPPGGTYYNRTKSYTSFPSMEKCLESGGRRSRR